MNQVKIVPSAQSGEIATPYASNPEFGYVQLEQSAISTDGGWIRETKRSTLLRASMDILGKFIAAHKTLVLPGKLVVSEFTEDSVPQAVADKNFRKDVPYEEAIAQYIKRAGNQGVELTSNGQRILRFTEYDPSDSKQDILVAHDNKDAVKSQRDAEAEHAFDSNSDAKLG